MQYARCNSDNQVWEAYQFSQLEPSLLEEKRSNLVCTECGEFAWFRKASKHGHPAHFCAHHADNCELKVEYVVSDDQRNDQTIEEDEIKSGDTIIVKLDEEEGGEINVDEVQKPPNEGQGIGGRTHVIKGEQKESLQQFTLRRILHRLVQSQKFRGSQSEIVFYKNSDEVFISGRVCDVICNFKDITKAHNDKTMFYWGPVAYAKLGDPPNVWLNSGRDYSSASVTIFEDIANRFFEMFRVEDLEDLAGAYVLVAGKCQFTRGGEGKPVIWCGSPKYIIIRKYRAASLNV